MSRNLGEPDAEFNPRGSALLGSEVRRSYCVGFGRRADGRRGVGTTSALALAGALLRARGLLWVGNSHHAATPIDPFGPDAASANDRFRLGAVGRVRSPDGGARRYLTLADVRGERPLLLGSVFRVGQIRPAAATGQRRLSQTAKWDYRPKAAVLVNTGPLARVEGKLPLMANLRRRCSCRLAGRQPSFPLPAEFATHPPYRARGREHLRSRWGSQHLACTARRLCLGQLHA